MTEGFPSAVVLVSSTSLIRRASEATVPAWEQRGIKRASRCNNRVSGTCSDAAHVLRERRQITSGLEELL